MTSTYDFAEPGFILIDRVNEMNNNWWCENIRATNPCGEQALPPYGSCLLGSVNLTSFVRHPFTRVRGVRLGGVSGGREDLHAHARQRGGGQRPAARKQREEILSKRRHGMGFLGLGSTMALLGMKYGSPESVKFTEDVSREMAVAGWEAALELAREKGPAPIMKEEFTVTKEMLRKRPEMARDGWKPGAKIPAGCCMRSTAATCSAWPRWPRSWCTSWPRWRALHASQLDRADGTISLSLANNASNGIEPSFAHHYFRNVIRDGKKSKEKIDVFSFELLAYRELVNASASWTDIDAEKLPDYFIAADDSHSEGACGRTGRGPEMGRFLDFQDGERADGFPVRAVQRHLPLCARAGPEGLHHLPLQPGGIPGRAGEGTGSEEHDLQVHPRGRHGGRGARRRGDRIRRRDPHRRESVRRPERRLLRRSSEHESA